MAGGEAWGHVIGAAFLRVDGGRDRLVKVKRRRFITFGSILAMVLALATVFYLVWFGVWHVRATEPVIDMRAPSNTMVVWKSDPDEITLTDSARSIMVQGTYTRKCNVCQIRHKYESECRGKTGDSGPIRGRRGASKPSAPPKTYMWGSFFWATFDSGNQSFRCVAFPPWIPIPVLAAFPALYFLVVGLRRFRRRGKNLCKHCDYDLTGNESGVCPECGSAVRAEWRSDGAVKVD